MSSATDENAETSESPVEQKEISTDSNENPVDSKENTIESNESPAESKEISVDATAGKTMAQIASSWNSGKCRKPNWTDIEVRTLMVEYDRHRDVMVSKAAYDSDGQKKPKGEKQKVWRVITEAVNRAQVESVNLLGNTAVERTLKDVIKKWVNLVNKMKCDFAAQRENPSFMPCPTSMAINTILFTNDPLDLDMFPICVRPQPDPPAKAETPPKSIVLPETSIKTSYTETNIDPHTGTPTDQDTQKQRSAASNDVPTETSDNTPSSITDVKHNCDKVTPQSGSESTKCEAPKTDNPVDNTQTQESLRQAILKRKASEIESTPDGASPADMSHDRRPARRRKFRAAPRDSPPVNHDNDPSPCKQETVQFDDVRLPNKTIYNDAIKPIKTSTSLNGSPYYNEVKNDPSRTPHIMKGHINDIHRGHNTNPFITHHPVDHRVNGIEDAHTNPGADFYNGDMVTDDFMQLNKEVLELKKHKLLMKISKLALEREKATNDKIRSEIEKDTARAMNRKAHLELERLENSMDRLNDKD